MGRVEERKARAAATTKRRLISVLIGGSLGLGLLWGLTQLGQEESGGGSAVSPISRLRTADFHSLAYSAADPETVFFGHHGGLKVSTDGGRTWQDSSLRNADAMALAAPASSPQTMYTAGHNVFLRSEDGGRSWQVVANNLPGLDIHGFAADPQDANRVYAHVVGFGLFRSDDGGETWELLTAEAAFLNLGIGENSATLYGTAAQNGVFKSTDGGRNWSRLAGPPGGGAIAVVFDRASDRLYVTTFGEGAGLYVSGDGGENWTPLGLDATLMAIAVSSFDPQHLIAVDDSGWVYASRDGGGTWGDE